jgi:hypothetical protein
MTPNPPPWLSGQPIGALEVVMVNWGGECPVQGFGTISVRRGMPHAWYFRARHQRWTVNFGHAEGIDADVGAGCVLGGPLSVAGPPDDPRPGAAGTMLDSEAHRHLQFALALFESGIRGYVCIPEPVCHVCGQRRTRVVDILDPATLSVCEAHARRSGR